MGQRPLSLASAESVLATAWPMARGPLFTIIVMTVVMGLWLLVLKQVYPRLVASRRYGVPPTYDSVTPTHTGLFDQRRGLTFCALGCVGVALVTTDVLGWVTGASVASFEITGEDTLVVYGSPFIQYLLALLVGVLFAPALTAMLLGRVSGGALLEDARAVCWRTVDIDVVRLLRDLWPLAFVAAIPFAATVDKQIVCDGEMLTLRAWGGLLEERLPVDARVTVVEKIAWESWRGTPVDGPDRAIALPDGRIIRRGGSYAEGLDELMDLLLRSGARRLSAEFLPREGDRR